MFKNLLVPLDGSSLAEAVLPAARSFGVRLKARVTLLHVVEPGASPTIHGDKHLLSAEDARVYLERIASEFRAAGVDVQWHVDIVERGNVARNIFAHTAELNADLVLLTSHGQSGWREVVFGNIAQQVIQSGSVPVFVVRPDTAQATFEPRMIQVPLDGSEVHEPSLYLAAELAKYYAASLHLVLVVPTTGTLPPERAATGVLLPTSTRAILELAERGAVEYLQGKVDAVKGPDLKVDAEVDRGAAAAKIVESAGRVNADLLVLSTHGRAGLDAFWEGSVTPSVLMHAHAPVILLRVFGKENPH